MHSLYVYGGHDRGSHRHRSRRSRPLCARPERRRPVRWSKLAENLKLRVIDEASDGLEALHKAEELKPDLVLLDIGLPKMNGIEAGRQLRKLDSKSKIIFVTQESSADVVEAALSAGAKGYVVKTFAQRDLIAAVESVISGKRFVSTAKANFKSSCQVNPRAKCDGGNTLPPG